MVAIVTRGVPASEPGSRVCWASAERASRSLIAQLPVARTHASAAENRDGERLERALHASVRV